MLLIITKKRLLIFFVFFLTHVNTPLKMDEPDHFYQFSAKDMDENDIAMSQYKGNVVVVVNVASKWGLTELNYKELVQLDEKYQEKGLRILAFPCNQFGNQEPGSNQEIKDFVAKYNVKFQMFDKINVNGSNAHPLFKFLKKKLTGFLINDIKWNFTKFVLDKEGNPIKRYGPKDNPLMMEPLIVQLLE